MWDIAIVFVLLCLLGVGLYYAYVYYRKKRFGEDIESPAAVFRNSGYGEQSTKSFTTAPWRRSTTSSKGHSNPGSKSSSLRSQTGKTNISDTAEVVIVSNNNDPEIKENRRNTKLQWTQIDLNEIPEEEQPRQLKPT